ncbi:MAG: riboflavin synthase [Deltaproteobacteria bacterium]|nr:riboflavin synthase [Deltaproteobacteria bacterium]MBW2445130.1 riboflavin synthase [Deltaproteobacteria bacterium]
MFTGIIETIGVVTSLERRGELAQFEVEAPAILEGVKIGDSVAVNGTCLTVTRIDPPRLAFDAVRETLEKTALGALEAGSRVNLERAMRADGRFDGHIVQGHVDATGTVRAVERAGTDVRVVVDTGEAFANELVPKGSVTIDGVSLTVVDVTDDGFDVVLIPHTLKETTLGERQPGDAVNLEADVLGKYVKRYLERIGPRQS